MAKKKPPVRRAIVTAKTASPKGSAKKGAKKPAALPAKPAAKPARSQAVSKKPAPAPKPKADSPFVSLGRPKVTGDEPLYLLFKEDYHARQIFAFLRVESVRELEQFAAAEIVSQLTRPIEESIERIRSKLAEKNRYLCGDEKYLIRYRQQAQADAEKE